MWSAVRIAFKRDRGHGNVWKLGEPRLERIVLRLTFGEPEAPPIVVDRNGDVIRPTFSTPASICFSGPKEAAACALAFGAAAAATSAKPAPRIRRRSTLMASAMVVSWTTGQRFWYEWKIKSLFFTLTWHDCPQSALAASAVIVPVALSWLKTAYPQPPFSAANRLLSFSMTKACVGDAGTSTTNGASLLFSCFHCSLTIFEPSGNVWPLPGMPAL